MPLSCGGPEIAGQSILVGSSRMFEVRVKGLRFRAPWVDKQRNCRSVFDLAGSPGFSIQLLQVATSQVRTPSSQPREAFAFLARHCLVLRRETSLKRTEPCTLSCRASEAFVVGPS